MPGEWVIRCSTDPRKSCIICVGSISLPNPCRRASPHRTPGWGSLLHHQHTTSPPGKFHEVLIKPDMNYYCSPHILNSPFQLLPLIRKNDQPFLSSLKNRWINAMKKCHGCHFATAVTQTATHPTCHYVYSEPTVDILSKMPPSKE